MRRCAARSPTSLSNWCGQRVRREQAWKEGDEKEGAASGAPTSYVHAGGRSLYRRPGFQSGGSVTAASMPQEGAAGAIALAAFLSKVPASPGRPGR